MTDWKIGYTACNLPSGMVYVSDRIVYSYMSVEDPRYKRKAKVTTVEPDAGVWERYRAALAAWDVVVAYEWTELGGPDYVTEICPPKPVEHTEYVETEEEWLARCRELAKTT